MKCDQCGKETNVLTYAVNLLDKRDLCADCFSRVPSTAPIHLEVQAVSTPNCTGEITVATPTFDQALSQLFQSANDLGAWTDIRLQEQEFYNREIGDSYLNWTTKERRKIKDRFKTMRKHHRAALKLKDAEILQLRERLDRAKRGS